jgi:UDP-N-acetylmuramoyl-tripeptide--D-alanyl-D-alanine ligase
MTTGDIIAWTGGQCARESEPREITGVSTDTRTLQPGNFYVALKGEKYDGHDFIPQAIEKSVRGVVISRHLDLPHGICVVKVDDTTEALKKIANGYRRSLKGQVIAVVGSNGKTTCKNMLATVLAKKFCVTKTTANNNNKIGVSHTLLSAQKQDEFIVVEAGTNAPGEVAELCTVMEPDHALLTNINAEHLEGFGDMEGVFREESEIFKHLKKQSFASLPADDACYRKLRALAECNIVSSGFDAGSDFHISQWLCTATGQQFKITEQKTSQTASVTLPFPGRHLAANAALCLALACRLGMDLQSASEALENFAPEKGRLNVLKTKDKTIIDDTYNANPAAMCAALDVLEALPGKKAAVLGDMGELGPNAAKFHLDVAHYINKKHIDIVIGVGSHAVNYSQSGKPFHHFATTQDAALRVADLLREMDAILVKGSRFMQMELIVNCLREEQC